MATISAPASAANLGPGFDALGLSLKIHNRLKIELAETSVLRIEGEGEGSLPLNQDNLIIRTIDYFYNEIGREAPPVNIEMKNSIPLARGMGSSAATIVAGLTAANAMSNAGLGRDDIFSMAAKIEGHPDNVAAAVYGGLTIAYRETGSEEFKVYSFPPRPDIKVLMLIPAERLSTEEARGALPETMNYADVSFNLSRVALLIKLLIDGDPKLLRTAVEDKMHQPFRARLIPGFEKTIEICYRAGALGAALSGAGPSVIVFTSDSDKDFLRDSIGDQLLNEGLNYKVVPSEIDNDGVVVSKH